MNSDLLNAFKELGKEKGILPEILFDAVEAALIAAYRKNFGSSQNVRVAIDRESGVFRVYARKIVVDSIDDEHLEILIDKAKTMDPRYELGDIIEIEATPKDFGRIAAQTAKQVVVQRIREIERGLVYEKFSKKLNSTLLEFFDSTISNILPLRWTSLWKSNILFAIFLISFRVICTMNMDFNNKQQKKRPLRTYT